MIILRIKYAFHHSIKARNDLFMYIIITMKSANIISFDNLGKNDVALVGGKNASLCEMTNQMKASGLVIPDGFATTASAFQYFLKHNQLNGVLENIFNELDTVNFSNLGTIGEKARNLVAAAEFPHDLKAEIIFAYSELCNKHGREVEVAVRSSATAEDLPTASFAGQHDSFLNVKGDADLIKAVLKCYTSLFNNRAIKYRHDNGFDQLKVYLSAGVQLMVRSDLSSSGVIFTLEPESGFKDVVVISGCWGLGENIVQGAVNPDEFHVFKPTLQQGKNAIISKRLGSKAKTMIYSADEFSGIINTDTPENKKKEWVLNNKEIEQLAKWSVAIEQHYKMPMDIEWAKDGIDNKLYIVQARPETVHSKKDPYLKTKYIVKQKGIELAKGNAIVSGIT